MGDFKAQQVLLEEQQKQALLTQGLEGGGPPTPEGGWDQPETEGDTAAAWEILKAGIEAEKREYEELGVIIAREQKFQIQLNYQAHLKRAELARTRRDRRPIQEPVRTWQNSSKTWDKSTSSPRLT